MTQPPACHAYSCAFVSWLFCIKGPSYLGTLAFFLARETRSYESKPNSRTMEDQRNPNGITALLVAAAKVHDEMSAPVGRANRVAPMVPSTDISEQLRQMSETFSALSTISNKVDTLAERVDNVEGGPSPPATSTPTSTARSPTTGSENRTPTEIAGTPWWQRDPNE